MRDTDIDAILRGRGSPKRWLMLSVVAAVVVVVAAVVAILFTRSGGSDVVIEPQRAEAAMGRLTTEVELSGSALSERSAELSFEAPGVVASVAVEEGDAVRAGDALASLDDSDARLRVETSAVQLRLAQLRLDSLMAGPAGSEITSANQAIASAKSQVTSAELALERLSDPPNAADLASAEQAVASANEQLSSAEQALDLLSEPPSAADLASAEQAVASANEQLSSAEQELKTLIAGPSEAELSEARSAVTQAQVQHADATRLKEDLNLELTEIFDEFCERFSGLIFSDAVIASTCRGTLPMTDAQIADMRESFEDEDVSAAYEELGNGLIVANVAFVSSAADKDSALATLTTADERLAELIETVPQDDLYQAEQAAEAARANHSAAVARLEDLRALPSEKDVYQAEQALEAAQANHAAAEARLEELPGVDEDDIEQAQASLATAQATMASAQAQYDELVSGPTENAIEQQEQDVRLAELSVEEARAALAGLTVYAPFDGTVEAVNVQQGDRVATAFSAFTLSTSNRMLIALTVTEEELLELEIGQTGLANFDAIEDFEYPVAIESISRVPSAEQGVVTYDVEARILTGEELVDAAGDGSAGGFRPRGEALGGPAGGPFGGFQLPEGVSFQQLRQLMVSLELPEGVTTQQVGQALASGRPLPEGVIPPDELENLMQMSQSPDEGDQGEDSQARSASPELGGPATRPLPAPGMSASVTILTEIREESVLIPISAVRQLDGDWFVSVPGLGGDDSEAGLTRVFVAVGESDGESVEIESGIEAGTVVLIGADNAGVAFSATLQQPQGNPGLPPGFGGFGPGGGGGRQ